MFGLIQVKWFVLPLKNMLYIELLFLNCPKMCKDGDLFRVCPTVAQQWLGWLQQPHDPRIDKPGPKDG